MAFLKGIGSKSIDFCSILANNNSFGFELSLSCKTFNSLSSTSGKCLPIILEASVWEIPFCKPNNLNKTPVGLFD